MDAGTLYAEIAKVCPVVSTRVGKADDRSTWSFEPGQGAATTQVDAGQNVINTIPADFKLPPEPLPGQTAFLDHENRLRTLEGQPAISAQDFLTKITATKAK